MDDKQSALKPNSEANIKDVGKTFTNIIEMISEQGKAIKEAVADYIRKPFDTPTPKEKVKKRPDGFDYVEGSWLDKSFKESSPLYEVDLLARYESMGWITYVVSVKDKITGNKEIGSGGTRIQVRRGAEEPNFRDIIDKGNNEAAALTKAIKNAQSRFGHAADVYHRRESVPSDEEKLRYTSMLEEIKNINQTRAYTFSDQWQQLGTDYGVYLDQWQVYVDRNQKASNGSNNKKTVI